MVVQIQPALLRLVVRHEVLCLREAVGVVPPAVGVDEAEDAAGDGGRCAACLAGERSFGVSMTCFIYLRSSIRRFSFEHASGVNQPEALTWKR